MRLRAFWLLVCCARESEFRVTRDKRHSRTLLARLRVSGGTFGVLGRSCAQPAFSRTGAFTAAAVARGPRLVALMPRRRNATPT